MVMRLNRRMVLRGAAGFTLGIPFLHSLLGRKQEAIAQTLSGPKYFVAMGTCDGGIWQEFMYPPEGSLTDAMDAPAGHEVRRGSLGLDVSDGMARMSPVLSASSSLLTSGLAAKLNVLRGLDVSFYMGHHGAGHLGNFGISDQGESLPYVPTIDQVLAHSEAFYGDASGILARSMVIGHDGMSWEEQSGGVTPISPNNDAGRLFESIFRPSTGEPEQARRPIVDLVMEDYRRLRDSNRRLSAADRVRLEEHLARLDELDRKLNVTPVVSCGDIQAPEERGSRNGDAAEQVAEAQMFMDVVAAAFACDTSRIATFLTGDANTEYSFSDYTGDWHGDVAHGAFDGSVEQGQRENYEAMLVEAGQTFFEGVFLYLAAKLDAIDQGDGTTLLDRALVQWTQEAGSETHTQIEMPVITAGSAGKFFPTGQYVDYRQSRGDGENGSPDPGILYNQYLGNVLQAMGLDPADYSIDGNGGYGRLHMGSESWYQGYDAYSSAAVSALDDILPFLS